MRPGRASTSMPQAWATASRSCQGPALESLAHLEGQFDLAFIDADKAGYPAYYDAVLPLVRPGGVIVADNVLRGGRVLDGGATDPGTVAMRAFNDRAATDPRVEAVILTLRDGVSLIRVRDERGDGVAAEGTDARVA